MATIIGFSLLTALAVAAALFLVSTRNLLHAVLALAVTTLSVAGLMLTLKAEFLAWVLILVYIGAVVVLGVFAVMLTGHFKRPSLPASHEIKLAAAVVSAALTALLTGVILTQPGLRLATLQPVTLASLGRMLLTDYILPFELVSVLLLAALIGAIVIARDSSKPHLK